jgi:hypothetical protein
VWDPCVPQLRQQLARARQRASFRQDLEEDLRMPALEDLELLAGQRPADLARHHACEQSSTHPDPAVDAPGVDHESRFRERTLPREDMRVDGVDERPIQIEDQRPHAGRL